MEYEQFEDQADLERTAGSEEARREYIKQTITVAADDSRNLVVMATVAVGIVVFLIKDSAPSIQKIGSPFPLLALLAAIALLISAGYVFWYAAHVNSRRMSLARCLTTSDAVKARDLWAGPRHGIRAEHGKLLIIGLVSMGLGLVFSAVVVGAILFSHPPA